MRLHSRTTGSGEHHVGLIHGLGASSATWQPLIERMLATGRFTVTTLDLRGHGESDRASSYSLDELAGDVVDALPQGLHSVVGHSLGGAVLVRAVARLKPEHAIYLDPGFGLTLPTRGFAGRAFWESASRATTNEGDDGCWRRPTTYAWGTPASGSRPWSSAA